MAETEQLRDPWLVAVWPGMGNVALAAGTYLVHKLGAKPAAEVPARDHFEVQHVEIKDGVAQVGRLPRSLFFQWIDPQKKHDLLIFLGEAQPSAQGYAFCHKVIDYAARRGVRRFFTFAAMATQLHPSDSPRVFGVATQKKSLRELEELEVEILKEGQISGLNGVFLAAGAERGLPGVCLLGELPFFAVGVPNPRASQAVLEVFTTMAGIELDLTEIEQQSAEAEKFLLQLLDRLNEAARQQAEAGEDPESAVREDSPQESGEAQLDAAARQRIEALFLQAQQDRSKAFQLKQELDRLGVFNQYENRFLDLFKKGE